MAMDPEVAEQLRLERCRTRAAQYDEIAALGEEVRARLGDGPTIAPVVGSTRRSPGR